ncbi:MAG TPA: HAMP domain-containing sensor histidine kinase [Solirubrobacteraceae bacterium]|nr:HAMP domain-containing sensor histidine kinase [Solirubrobacteraceae bacterium]
MRRRLLLVLLPLLTALLVALEVPLMQAYADRQTLDLFAEQLAEAEEFADGAEPFLRDGTEKESLRSEVRTFTKVTPGATLSVFNNEGHRVLPDVSSASPATEAAADHFLVNREIQPPPTVWPWNTARMTVGKTVGRRGPPIGAVVLEVPTESVRDRVLVRMGVLAGGGVAVLLLVGALCALPLARWILRPVHDLNATAGRLAAGGLDARASERGGPPELRGLARAFNEMADTLVAALQRQRAFVADASHELRTPLATLRLRLEALAASTRDGARDARLALGEADRLAAVVDRLLELARAEATAAEQVDFDVVALTEERVTAWQPALRAAGSEARLEVPAEAFASGSPEALRYALDVVLDNARKFASGSPIDVAVATAADRVELTVRDYGPALPAPELARVGERFWRSPRHRRVAGTGLGLATARVLLESAGASLDVELREPGLAVVLRLPAATGSLLDTSAARPGAGSADMSSARRAG